MHAPSATCEIDLPPSVALRRQERNRYARAHTHSTEGIRALVLRESLIADARACARMRLRHCWHDLFPCLRPKTTLSFFSSPLAHSFCRERPLLHHTLAPVGSLDQQRAS